MKDTHRAMKRTKSRIIASDEDNNDDDDDDYDEDNESTFQFFTIK